MPYHLEKLATKFTYLNNNVDTNRGIIRVFLWGRYEHYFQLSRRGYTFHHYTKKPNDKL